MTTASQTNPLLDIDFLKCKPFEKYWREQWDNPETPFQIREALIRSIFTALPEYEAILFLIEIADGYNQVKWCFEKFDYKTDEYLEIRRNLSRVAVEVLCSADIFRDRVNKKTFNVAWLILDENFQLLQQLLWFFLDRKRRRLDYSNLAISKSNARQLAKALIDTFWGKRLCTHDRNVTCELSCLQKQKKYQIIKPDLFELMVLIGKLDENSCIVRNAEFILDERCIERLKELACMRTICRGHGEEYPYQPFANAAEAMIREGNGFAYLYLSIDIYLAELQAEAKK